MVRKGKYHAIEVSLRGRSARPPRSATGAEIIVEALLRQGVETVFGYIGASVLPLFDRLYDAPIRLVVPCHEQGRDVLETAE